MNLSRLTMSAVIATLLVATASTAPAAQAAESDAKSDSNKVSDTTSILIKFAHPLSLADAIDVAQSEDIAGSVFRFENQTLVGEYSTSSGVPLDQYLEKFRSDFGVEPAVVGVRTNISLEESRTLGSNEVQTNFGANLELQASQEMRPDSHIGSQLRKIQAQHSIAKQSRTATTTMTRWDPNFVMQDVTRNTGSTYTSIVGNYVWSDLDTSPLLIPDTYGLEFEVNAFTPNVVGLFRPYCVPGTPIYKDIPFAKNHDWNWSAWVSNPNTYGTIFNPATLGVYADYNDLSDECDRNSLAVGVAVGNEIPLAYNSYVYTFGMQIDAPNGSDSTGEISAVVQSVTGSYCISNPTMALTNCMGIDPPSWADHRMVLNKNRGWTAPNKCWISDSYGSVAPVTQACSVY